MFNQTRQHPEWRLLAERTKDAEFGTTIGYQEIEKIVGLSRKDRRFGSMIARWKREMQKEYHRTVQAVPNEGYKVLTFKELGPRSKEVMRHGLRRIRKGVAILENAPFDQLPDDLRRTYIDSGVRAGMMAQMVSEKLRDIPVLPGGTERKTPRMLKPT